MQGKVVQPKKKRIAPQKEAELPVVASVPEDIVAASFRDDDASRNVPPVRRRATGGIAIEIRKTPMVNIQPELRKHELEWCSGASQTTEGGAPTRLKQPDVVKRILERQTRIFQVRDDLSEPDSECSESGMSDDGGGSEEPSEMDASDEEEEEKAADVTEDPTADAMHVTEDVMEKSEEGEALDEEQEEEWGLKNIGDYDIDDDFIDDSEIHHYFDNIRKRTKYSGFYIHKGPLRMIEQSVEQKTTKAGVKKPKGEGKGKTETARTNIDTQEQAKRRPAPKKSKASQQRSVSRADPKNGTQNGRPSSSTSAKDAIPPI